MLTPNPRRFNDAGAPALTPPDRSERVTVLVQPDPSSPPSSASRVAVDVRRFPWIRRLAADYAFDFPRLSRFFAGDPAQPGAWSDAIAHARTLPRNRPVLVDVLRAQQDRRGAPAEAKEAAGRLADAATVAVVTGQQAGLFGGPLFTLFKAMTALKLAERATGQHGVPSVAVFWIESEDHDWQEVSSCSVLDGDMARRTIALGTPPGAGDSPISSIVLDPSIIAAVDGLRATLATTEFTAATLDAVARAYRPGAGMSTAFGAWLESLLGRFGLVVYDASDPGAKSLAAGVFSRELESPGTTTRLATAQGRALAELGYHAQVEPHEGGAALFVLDRGRQAVRYRDGQFLVGETTVAAAELVDRSRRRPELFSPNVLLRPIVQDTLFPTIAYVAGPNELAYLAQLRPVYEHFGVPQPLMVPRATATLLDAAGAKFLAKYRVAFETLQPDNESALNQLLEGQLPAAVEDAFAEVSRAVEHGMARLADVVPAIDPTLAGAARSSLGKMQHDLGALHDKIVHGAKRRDETLRRQFARVRAQAFPEGRPQERAVGFVYFLNRYGPALLDRLHDDLPLDMGSHWILTL
jgi:bacillithiol biosynthesis cysteine-adding enzyme BshC